MTAACLAAVVAARASLGCFLLLAGAAKLELDRRDRRLWLESYQLLPAALTPAVSMTVPLLELLIGAALVTGAFEPAAGVAASLLLIVITAAAASALVRGLRPACGCLGKRRPSLLSWPVVIRNLALIAVAAATARSNPNPIGFRSPAAQLVVTALVAVAAAGLAVALMRPPATSSPGGSHGN